MAAEHYRRAADAYRAEGRPILAEHMLGVAADTHLSRGDLAAAERQIAALQPSPVRTALEGDLALARGRFDAAADAYHRLWDSSPHAHWRGIAAASLGVVALRQGESGEARRWFVDAVRRLGAISHPYVHVAAAGAAVDCLREGGLAEARRFAAMARRIPQNAWLWEELDAAPPEPASAPAPTVGAGDTFDWGDGER